MRWKHTAATTRLAALLTSGVMVFPAVSAADGRAVALLSVASPPNPEDPTLQLTVAGLPGNYAIWACADLLVGWTRETNVVVGLEGTADVAVERNERSVLLLRAEATDAVSLLTLGSTIEPQVFIDGAEVESFLWTWDDGSTDASHPLASKDFGTPAARLQRLAVTPREAITAINLGFDGADGGGATPLPQRPPQNVAAAWFPAPLPELNCWASSYNPITNTLDFSGFNGLEYIECYYCTNLQQVVVTNLPALRRVCLEACDLRELDLSGNPNLGDVRAALNAFTNIVVGRGTGPKIWHWCTRDNPQLTQQFTDIMTNFHSLRELYIWNDNQTGHLAVGSTNLTSVWAFRNQFASADFTGQSNLSSVILSDNALTNLVLTGCTNLRRLEAQRNQLPAAVLDNLLASLDAFAPNLESVDLSANAQFPSVIGYTHYSNLVDRGVTVSLDFRDSNDGRYNVPGGTNAITFVTSSQYPHMEIRIDTGIATDIFWHWGDGTFQTNISVASHDFGSPGLRTNYVRVLPRTAVTYFGTPQGVTDQGIRAVYGAANFPNLSFLYLYREELVDLSIAGCANLRQLHLARNPVPTSVCDQWFIDLDGAVTGPVTGADFWYPASQRSAASDGAWTSLVGKGYVMHPYN